MRPRRAADIRGVATPQYDPSLIERYAEQLYRKADAVRYGSIAAGALLGLVFGAVPLSPLGQSLPVPASFGVATLLLGTLVGGFIGYVVGDGRAFRTRVQAQLVLAQLERATAPVAAPAPTETLAPLLTIQPATPRPLTIVPAPADELPLPPLSPTA
jgi:hypothetical protein